MAIRTSDRKLITIDVPAEFFMLQVPPGWTLDKWYKHETARLAKMFPEPKMAAVEVPREFADMLTAVGTFEAWAKKKKLLKLKFRETMEWAEYATVDGHQIAKRQMYHVRDYRVPEYDVDTVIAVL